MSKFKIGEKIKHKLGYVGVLMSNCEGKLSVNIYNEPISTTDNHATTVCWFAEDCEPVIEKQPVDADLYEAAGALLRQVFNFSDLLTPNQVQSALWTDVGVVVEELKQALTNSKPFKPQGWITDRKPTEDDAWESDNSLWVIVGDPDDMFIPSLIEDVRAGDPWQPVPHCLRTKP